MKGQNKDHEPSNRTNLALYSVTIPEVFRTRYSLGTLRYSTARPYYGCFGRDGLG